MNLREFHTHAIHNQLLLCAKNFANNEMQIIYWTQNLDKIYIEQEFIYFIHNMK